MAAVGHVGPYVSDAGGVWVPRTIPYLEARHVAKTAMYDSEVRLAYVGKEDADLLGFTRDCWCEERCYGGPVDEATGDPAPDPACRVPAWRFQLTDPWGEPRPRE